MNRILGTALICLATLTVFGQSQKSIPESQIDLQHTKWIESVLRSIQNVKVGQTRSDLLRVFTVEGGLSTTSQRTYVYRDCAYIKVDVKFAVSNPNEELPTDKIVEISRPYLEWSIVD